MKRSGGVIFMAGVGVALLTLAASPVFEAVMAGSARTVLPFHDQYVFVGSSQVLGVFEKEGDLYTRLQELPVADRVRDLLLIPPFLISANGWAGFNVYRMEEGSLKKVANFTSEGFAIQVFHARKDTLVLVEKNAGFHLATLSADGTLQQVRYQKVDGLMTARLLYDTLLFAAVRPQGIALYSLHQNKELGRETLPCTLQDFAARLFRLVAFCTDTTGYLLGITPNPPGLYPVGRFAYGGGLERVHWEEDVLVLARGRLGVDLYALKNDTLKLLWNLQGGARHAYDARLLGRTLYLAAGGEGFKVFQVPKGLFGS